ncbi:MAG TPA: WD40 repeat domain-containing protein, partial [Gemmataceae bacterium]
KILASASEDKMIKLWDVAKGTETATLKGHTDSVRSIAFSPDGKMLASGGMDRTLRLWDVASRKEIAILTDRLGNTATLIFSVDGKTLFSGGFFWDIPTRKMREDIRPRLPVNSSGWFQTSPYRAEDKLLIVICTRGTGTIELWDVIANKSLRRLEHPEKGVFFGRCGAFTPDNKIYAEAAHWLCVWDVQTGKLLVTSKRPGPTTRIAFSPDGKLLAAAWQGKGTKGELSILDAATGKELAALEGHNWGINCLAFSPDGRILASGDGGDWLIKLWDVRGVKAAKKD